MNKKNRLFKRMTILGSILVVAALLLTGCNGTFALQGSANPNEEGGLDISGGLQDTDGQTAGNTGMTTTTIILIVVGIALFILVLVLVASRGRSHGGDQG